MQAETSLECFLLLLFHVWPFGRIFGWFKFRPESLKLLLASIWSCCAACTFKLKSEQTVAQCQTPCTWQLVDLALLICTGCNLDCHNLELVAADISLISSNSSFFFNPRTNPWSKDLCNQSLLLSPIQCSSNICQKCFSPEKKVQSMLKYISV